MSGNDEVVVSSGLSRRAQRTEPFRVMEILAEARRLQANGRDIIHLEVGEPDFPTPDLVVEAASRAMQDGVTRYTAAEGLAELRAAIAADYQRLYGLHIDAERIIVTAGASAALQLALAATTDAGDSVLLPDPGYPCNRQFVSVLGAEALILPVDAKTAFQPDRQQLELAWKDNTRALMLASPTNPTGNCVPVDLLNSLEAFLGIHRGSLIMDEIYGRLVFDRTPETVLSRVPNAFVVNSFSKYAAMTGWRLGWMVVPEYAVAAVRRLAQNLFVAPSTLAQVAALHVFDPEVEHLLQERVEELAKRRNFLLAQLPRLGLQLQAVPEGAFYLYADCRSLGDDSQQVCAFLLREAGVAVTPGTDFSSLSGCHYLRIAYTQPLERLQEAVQRMLKVL